MTSNSCYFFTALRWRTPHLATAKIGNLRLDQQKNNSALLITYFWDESLSATVHQKPTNVGGELMAATVGDPWGNIVGIIYNPHFKLPKA